MAIKEVRREWDECQLDFVKEFILDAFNPSVSPEWWEVAET